MAKRLRSVGSWLVALTIGALSVAPVGGQGSLTPGRRQVSPSFSGTVTFPDGSTWAASGPALVSASCVGWNADTFLQRASSGVVGISATCGGANTAGLVLATGTASASFVAPIFRAASATILTLSTDGKVLLTDSAATHGVTFGLTTDGDLNLYKRDGTTRGNFYAAFLQSYGNLAANASNGASAGFIVYNTAGNGQQILPSGSTDGALRFNDSNNNHGIVVNFTADGTLDVRKRDGTTAGNLTAGGTITFAGLASVSGVRYVCASTTGVLDGQAVACVGTEATALAYAQDGYTLPKTTEFQALREEILALRQELQALKAGVR